MATGLPYNGWSALIRHGRDRHYYHAQQKKLLPQFPMCICCNVDLSPDWITYHSEEYGPTLEDYWASAVPMCHRCHAMLHARFLTPNRWKRYLHQAVSGAIDDEEYPLSKSIAPMLSRFRSRKDIDFCEMPEGAPQYFKDLPEDECLESTKAATLLVIDQDTSEEVEVPDWTLYGEDLELLPAEDRQVLVERGIDVEGFLIRKASLPRNSAGKLIYKRLYADKDAASRPPKFVWQPGDITVVSRPGEEGAPGD